MGKLDTGFTQIHTDFIATTGVGAKHGKESLRESNFNRFFTSFRMTVKINPQAGLGAKHNG